MNNNQVDTLSEFAEFCHDYYAGTYKEQPWGEWRYGYHHEVATMLELFLARERIVDTVVTDLAAPGFKSLRTPTNPQPSSTLIDK